MVVHKTNFSYVEIETSLCYMTCLKKSNKQMGWRDGSAVALHKAFAEGQVQFPAPMSTGL